MVTLLTGYLATTYKAQPAKPSLGQIAWLELPIFNECPVTLGEKQKGGSVSEQTPKPAERNRISEWRTENSLLPPWMRSSTVNI